jgi:hypothetical protein
MKPGLCCPRCGRYNPSRAKFCANCGLSFLSAGVISGNDRTSQARGSGVLGVLAGFLLVFILVAILSFVRIMLPRDMDFGSRFAIPAEQHKFRIDPDEQRRFIHRETRWSFELPSRPGVYLHRHYQCPN